MATRGFVLFAAALFLAAPAHAERPSWPDVEGAYTAVAAVRGDQSFAVAVDLGDENLSLAYEGGRLRLLYRMNFNNIAEGWSWQPLADPAREDYYRYKFLPLGTVEREVGAPYIQEDMPGRPREVRRKWRYDYFLAFENPYDFYTRPTVEDDAGFAAELPMGEAEARALMQPGRIGLLAWARAAQPAQSESTTFWKATDGKPVDLTLKNRYLMGRLEALAFIDNTDGRVLVRLAPVSR